jgi:8-oxo-dGTP diphosphatase
MLKVTCAIIVKRNKILVAQRNTSSNHPFKWEFPGGKLKLPETIEECIIREIKEELDIEIEIREAMITVFHDYEHKQIELIPFLCILKSGDIKLIEHHDFMWITFGNLKNIDFADADMKLIQQNGNKMILKKYLWKNMNNTR